MNLITFNCKIIINTHISYNIQFVHGIYSSDPVSLLNVLEQHNISINYQCRSGYCGCCRVYLKSGIIKYYKNILASCFYSNEIFTCSCYPISHIILKI